MATHRLSLLPTAHHLLMLLLLLLLRSVVSFELKFMNTTGGSLTWPRPISTHTPISTNLTVPVWPMQGGLFYVIPFSVGSTGESRGHRCNFNLILDTSGDMTWWQCKGCSPLFKQTIPLFDPTISSKPLPCTSPLLGKNICVREKYCFYSIKDDRGKQMVGYLYTDSVWFHVGDIEYVGFRHFTFGCNTRTFRQNVNLGGEVVGVLGMNRQPLSLISQMGASPQPLFSRRRFSYCLHGGSASVSLRIGESAVMREQTPVTAVLWNIPQYTVDFLGFSFGWTRIDFRVKPLWRYGMIVTTAIAFSELPETVYERMLTTVETYMERKGYVALRRAEGKAFHCWMVDSVTGLPGTTFHLDGGDLVVKPEHVFFLQQTMGGMAGCLAMTPNPSDGTYMYLGTKQQLNTRFLFDLDSNVLQFAPTDCFQNP